MAFGTPVVWNATNGPGTGWLWGPRADLFWIAGGGFFLFAALLLPVAYVPGGGDLVTTVLLHAAIVCNYPHYAATYQVIVRERKIKPGPFRWLLVSTPLMLGVLILGSIYSGLLWGLLVRLYLTWSAHHYSAQNFGLSAMYMMRFGRPLTDSEKRPLQFAFLALGAVTMICANTAGGDPELAARVVGQAEGYDEAIPIAQFPAWFYQAAMLLGIAAVGAFAYARHLVVSRTGKGFEPAVWMLFATNLVWMVIPQIRRLDGTSWMSAAVILTMLGLPPFFHCAQYLAVTLHRTRWTGDVKPIWLFAALVYAGYVLFHGLVPVLPRVFPISEAHGILILIAVINLHHFWMDGLMWRRPRRAPGAAPAPGSERAPERDPAPSPALTS